MHKPNIAKDYKLSQFFISYDILHKIIEIYNLTYVQKNNKGEDMKINKYFKLGLICAVLVPCMLLLSACQIKVPVKEFITLGFNAERN